MKIPTMVLYEALCEKGVKTFIDNEIQGGEEILVELYKTIKFSMISIIIFSQNYTFLTWCWEELVKILNYKQNEQLVLPIFYKVDPSEVCKQERNFNVALAKPKNKFKNNIEVERWRVALVWLDGILRINMYLITNVVCFYDFRLLMFLLQPQHAN